MTRLEMLYAFYNEHLEKLISSTIYSTYYSELKPDEVVLIVRTPSGQPGMPGVERNIKAKELRDKEVKIKGTTEHYLRVIQRLIDEEKKKEKNA